MNNNRTGPPPIVYLAAAALLGAGYWGLGQWEGINFGRIHIPSFAELADSTTNPALAIEQQISAGERILIQPEALGAPTIAELAAAKQQGALALAAGNFAQAVTAFEHARTLYRNDPETLIYLNNARIGNTPSYGVAVTVPIGGNTTPFALEMLRGFAQAQHQINQAGGINGRPLKLWIVDDNDDPARAAELVPVLADNPDILAVMGHWSSGTTLAAAPAYDQHQLVLINPVSTSTDITGISDYVFRMIPNNAIVGRTMADYALTQQSASAVAVFYDSTSAYSESLKTEFASAVSARGGRMAGEFDLSIAEFRAGSLVESAIAQGAEALFLVPAPDTVDRALQLVAANDRQLALLGDIGNLYGMKTLEVGRQAAVGMVLPIPWHIDSDPTAAFTQTSRQLWGADVNWATALTYDSTQALIQAVRQAPSRAGIQQVLASSDFTAPGVREPIRFTPSGDRSASLQLVDVQASSPSRSGTGYDFVPIP